MHSRTNMSFAMYLGVIGGLAAACDERPYPEAELELGVVAWPGPALAEPSVELAGSAASAGLSLAAAPRSTAHNPNPREALAVKWMRWASGLPWTDGPINDPTGERCAMGQDGPVWFLAGTSGGAVTRDCAIPVGKQLFFPLINYWLTFNPQYFPDAASFEPILPQIDALYQMLSGSICSLTLRLDGEEVLPGFDAMNEELYVRIVEPFEVMLHDESLPVIYGLPSGPAWVSGHGHYAWIPPLPPGDHVLELGGESCAPFVFETAATYHLHIVN